MTSSASTVVSARPNRSAWRSHRPYMPSPDKNRALRGGKYRPRNALFLSGLGMYGRWLRQAERFGRALTTVEAEEVIHGLVKVLHEQNLLARVVERGEPGYRLKSSAMVLRPGDGKAGAPDPVRRRFEADQRPRVVPFFRDLYL